MRILFVCMGNICRSPMAAGIMRRIFEDRGITGHIDSAGTENWNAGSRADPRSVRVALSRGVDLRDHRARQIRPADFDKFDHIIVMDSHNLMSVNQIVPESGRQKVRLLLQSADGRRRDVPDPFHGDDGLFSATFELIHQGCIALAADLGCAEESQRGI